MPDAFTFSFNAPFAIPLQSGSKFSPSITYRLTSGLPSLTIFDYWDPVSSISRVLTGAAIDVMNVKVNGDYHEFSFAGPAADLVDSHSFRPPQAGLNTFPAEPEQDRYDYSIVPGHLGEVWIGEPANRFFTLCEAAIQLRNNIHTRTNEFGSTLPLAVVPGNRTVTADFSLLAQDDDQTLALAIAAKQGTTTPAMLQLGQRQGQLMGIFMPQVKPEVPVFDDGETRLKWNFNNNLAQGAGDDELYIAFA